MDKEDSSFEQRIGIYLMNSLACQVNDVQKETLGDLGIIEVQRFSCKCFVFGMRVLHSDWVVFFLENAFFD